MKLPNKKRILEIKDKYPNTLRVFLGYWKCTGSMSKEYRDKHDKILEEAFRELK